MSDQLQQEIVDMVSRELNVEPAKIDPNAPLIIYGADSFSLFNLKYNLEQKYKVTLFTTFPMVEATVNKVVSEVQLLQHD